MSGLVPSTSGSEKSEPAARVVVSNAADDLVGLPIEDVSLAAQRSRKEFWSQDLKAGAEVPFAVFSRDHQSGRIVTNCPCWRMPDPDTVFLWRSH